jgi:hypothetical protein
MAMPMRLLLMIAAVLIAASPGLASPGEDRLAAFLAKKYGKADRFTAVFNKVFPQQASTTTPVPFEGRKADGSYWWGAYFGNGNVVVLSWPYKSLVKHCESGGGTMMPAMLYSLSDGPPAAPVQLTDPSSGSDVTLTPAMLRGWSANSEAATNAESLGRAKYQSNSRNAELVDARKIIGVFTCRATEGGRVLWHVAILPTPVGDWNNFANSQMSGTSWVMLRILAIDRALIDRTAAVFAAKEGEDRARRGQSDALAIQRETEAAARARAELPKLAAFQAKVAIGDDTNCGLVLGFKGPLVNVQVPANIKLPSGASTVFVKRTALTPPRSRHNCYEYGNFTGLWYVGREIGMDDMR